MKRRARTKTLDPHKLMLVKRKENCRSSRRSRGISSRFLNIWPSLKLILRLMTILTKLKRSQMWCWRRSIHPNLLGQCMVALMAGTQWIQWVHNVAISWMCHCTIRCLDNRQCSQPALSKRVIRVWPAANWSKAMLKTTNAWKKLRSFWSNSWLVWASIHRIMVVCHLIQLFCCLWPIWTNITWRWMLHWHLHAF